MLQRLARWVQLAFSISWRSARGTLTICAAVLALPNQLGRKTFMIPVVEQRANDQNNDVAAEDQDRYRPADDVRNREHQKHGAQEQLVGDRVQILAQRCFLLQYAGQEAVQSISDSGGHKDDQRPAIVLLLDCDYYKRNKDQAHQREQVGGGAELAQHYCCSWKYLPMSTPVLAANWSASEGSSPLRPSTSIRCTRCMGKNTTLGVADSPDFTICVKSSSDCKSTPRRLTPAGVSASTMPQNFSRGFCKVTSTSCPVFILSLRPLPVRRYA